MVYRCSGRVEFAVSHPFHKEREMDGHEAMMQLQAVSELMMPNSMVILVPVWSAAARYFVPRD
jgi:predicted protein tyrosine phosphatase